ncbi:MAG: 4'-phosphopantetheinyl transferase family protein [Thermoanaerobaculia bacterium]
MTRPMLWTAFETAAGLPAWQEPVPWLTPFENARLARFRVPKRRSEWLLGRFTVKRLVRDASPEVLGRALSPETFEIASEDSGAPFVRDVSGERLPICVTVSHARGAAFCALLPAERGEGAIGGDVEWIEPRSRAFVSVFFTPAEAAAWEESPPAERPLLANAIWSAKESVLKALSLGLSVDTRSVEIRLSIEPAEEALRPPERSWRRFEAVCAAGIDAGVIPLSGLWTLRGPFVVTLAARLSAPPGKDRHVDHRNDRGQGNGHAHGELRPRAA